MKQINGKKRHLIVGTVWALGLSFLLITPSGIALQEGKTAEFQKIQAPWGKESPLESLKKGVQDWTHSLQFFFIERKAHLWMDQIERMASMRVDFGASNWESCYEQAGLPESAEPSDAGSSCPADQIEVVQNLQKDQRGLLEFINAEPQARKILLNHCFLLEQRIKILKNTSFGHTQEEQKILVSLQASLDALNWVLSPERLHGKFGALQIPEGLAIAVMSRPGLRLARPRRRVLKRSSNEGQQQSMQTLSTLDILNAQESGLQQPF
jgi:hypothetical protein